MILSTVKQSLDTGTKMSWTSISLHTVWRQIRNECAPWYSEVSKECFQYGAERASVALTNWSASKKGKRAGQKVGSPRFRKRGKNDSVKFTTAKLRACGLRVRLPLVGDVNLVEGFQLAVGQRVTSVTIRRTAGRWFSTFQVREDTWTEPAKRPGSTIGVDFGVGSRFATLSDGQIVDNPRFFRSDAERLARAQKALSRKKKGSANRSKAQDKVARIHYQIGCRRKDFAHKFTTSLSKTHARIVVEDLNLVGMSNKAGFKLGKSVHDVALAEARRQLVYKSRWYGSQLIVADRWFPSSKTCHVCKAINAGLKLSERSWECVCGVVHDRDLNAAVNLELLAGSSPVSACGDDVRPELALAVVCEAGSDVVEFDHVSRTDHITMPTPRETDAAALVTVLGPPPPARDPGGHPWAAAATAWAERMNSLQGAAEHSVFTTIDNTGVHLSYWPTTTCPRCGNPQPTTGTPWTVPPAGDGAVSWGWRHPCGARWAPEVTVLRWTDLEQHVQVGPAPHITTARLLDALASWYLTNRQRLIADDDDDALSMAAEPQHGTVGDLAGAGVAHRQVDQRLSTK